MLIVIHFGPSRSLFYRSFVSGIVKKCALNQNKNTNLIAYRNTGNCPYSQNFGVPRNRGPRLKPFLPSGRSAPGLALFTVLRGKE